MLIFTILYFLCGIIYAIFGLVTYLNDSQNKLNRFFGVICLSLTFWAVTFAMINGAADAQRARLFYIYSTVSWSVFHCLLLHFTMILTGKDRIFKKRGVYGLFYLPALISFVLYSIQPPAAENFVRSDWGWVILAASDQSFIWMHFYNAYYFAYMTGVVYLLYQAWQNSKIIRERKQAKLIMITVVITALAAGVTDVLLPTWGIAQMPMIGIIIMILPIIAIWYSIKKYKLMDLNPENFALEVLKIMNEGLIIVNHHGVIKDINNGALKLLGYEKKQLKDQRVDVLFAENVSLSELNNCSSLEIEMLKSDHHPLPVLLSSAVLQDEWGGALGTVGIFQDISEIKQVQRKLINASDELEIKVAARTSELSSANQELELEINKRIAMEEKIKYLAYFDHLTGLPNRRLFNDRLNQRIINRDRQEKAIGVLFLDLDSFKRINDTMGHAKGDELLKLVASRLKNALREGDTVCRVGGDEFLILIEYIENKADIGMVAEKILEIFQKPFNIDNHDLYITTSIGGAIYPIDGKDVETLIKNADIAMYRAKEKGNNRFELCTPLIKNSVVEEMKLTNSLYRALERNELELYYQPQVNIKSGEIIGLEALIRWHHRKFGIINPLDFIHIAEKTGLILPIGEWVIRSACRQNKAWQAAGIVNVPIAVNLSVNQFQNTRIVEDIGKILRESELDPRDLELEITENIIMKETDYIVDSLKQLKQLGVKIAIDDFGTEYSSLNYIKQLPVDKIKIAMSFIRGINLNEKDEAIINVIIVLAKNLGLKVIAEGVETKEQLDFLRKQLCDEVQGFYYYKPMTAPQIEKLMRKISNG